MERLVLHKTRRHMELSTIICSRAARRQWNVSNIMYSAAVNHARGWSSVQASCTTFPDIENGNIAAEEHRILTKHGTRIDFFLIRAHLTLEAPEQEA